jgi:hypothetical protein
MRLKTYKHRVLMSLWKASLDFRLDLKADPTELVLLVARMFLTSGDNKITREL